MSGKSRWMSVVVLGVLAVCGGRALAATRTFQGTQDANCMTITWTPTSLPTWPLIPRNR